MFVIYQGSDEILVTTEKHEKKFLKEYFGVGTGRITEVKADELDNVPVPHDVDIYSRDTVPDLGVIVSTRLSFE